MATPPDDGSNPKGFAGLNSLVSDVEIDIPASTGPQASTVATRAEATSDVESGSPSGQQDVPTSPAEELPRSERSSSSGSGTRWAVGLALGIGAILLLANIDHKNGTSSDYPSPAPVVSAPSQDVWQNSGLESLVEEMPPVGQNLVLSVPQVRWCVFEKARMEMMKELATDDEEITAFNTYVSRYNARCAQFRYRQGVLATIEGELGQQGRRLQSEGAERILALRSSPKAPDKQDTASAQLRLPQPDAPSLPAKELPGASANPSAVAPAAPMSSREPGGDIEVVRSDFGLFSRPDSGKPAFEVSRRVPLQEGQGYGWFVELNTTKPKIKWREEMVVPSPPATWGIQNSTAQHTISDDRRTLTTEREVVPNRGIIHNVWAVAAGDPKGPHVVRVYVEGKLVRTFEFETE